MMYQIYFIDLYKVALKLCDFVCVPYVETHVSSRAHGASAQS